MSNINKLVGKTITEIEQKKFKNYYPGAQELIFHCTTGERYSMYHSQDCCEMVYLAEIIGDLNDLIGNPILKAEEVVSENKTPEGVSGPNDIGSEGSFTWTFYKFATIKGYVDLRWLGESNGYYSESVDFEEITI